MFWTVIGWIGLLVSGILLGGIIVILAKVKSLRKTIISSANVERRTVPHGSVEDVEKIVKSKRKEYLKANKFVIFKTFLGIKGKKSQKCYIKMYLDIIGEVANIINPNSENPLLEFSVAQAFEFFNEVTHKTENIIDSLNLPVLKNLDMSTVFWFINIKSTFDRSKTGKVVKGVSKVAKPIAKVLKVLNPVKLINSLVTAILISSATRNLIFALADLVAWEFVKFYENCRVENTKKVA